MQLRREVLSWPDVDKLIDHLIPQFETEFEAQLNEKCPHLLVEPKQK